MGLHIVFLFLHLLVGVVNDPVLVSAMFIAHCITYVAVAATKGEKINVMFAFAGGIAIISLANAILAYRVMKTGVDMSSMYYYVLPEYINDSTVLWSVGNTFVFIGYELFKKRSLPSLSIIVRSARGLDNIFKGIVFMVVLGFMGYTVNLGGISGGLQKLLTLSGVMTLLMFARLWGKTGNAKYRNYSFALCIYLVINALFAGFLRIELATPFIIFFGGYFIGKGSIRYVFSFRIIPVILIVVVFSSVFGNLGTRRSHFIDAFSSTEEEVAPSYTIENLQHSDRNSLLIRGANIAQISNIYGLVERNGYYGGRASLPLVYAFIPRAIWPDKPSIELGAWYALEIGAATISAATGRSNNSINMSVPGQLYLDFGWIGVIVGCMFFGLAMALFWNAAGFNESAYNVVGVLWGGLPALLRPFRYRCRPSDIRYTYLYLSVYTSH